MEDKLIIELKKISLDTHDEEENKESKDKNVKNDTNSILYYDKYIRNIFDIHANGITVYKRNAKDLKVNFNISIPKESLLSIAADKELKYLLCLMAISQGEKAKTKDLYKTKIILIKTLTKKSVDKIEDNYFYLLGMFFIGIINNMIYLDSNNTNNQNNLYDFCLVHCDKVEFYGIEPKNNDEEKIKKLNTISISNNLLIKDFSYDYKHKILCLVKTDLSVSFIILTNRKNYKNLISPPIEYIINLKQKITSIGLFRKINEEQKKRVKGDFENIDKYTETQFYLQTIYKSLYLICLCFEDNKIYAHKLENLNVLPPPLIIDYPYKARCSALQVVDNLLIVHDFLSNIIVIIDIKSKIPILRKFNINFCYPSSLRINGEILEERQIFSRKKLINYNGGNLYLINFNSKIYDEISDKELKMSLEEKKKKKNEKKLKKKK